MCRRGKSTSSAFLKKMFFDMPFDWLSLGTGLADSFSGLFNAGQQYKNQKKLMEQQHQYNLETMAKQQEYAVQNWQMNNEYNDPSAVVDRYKNAGIDANAAFGGSGHYTPSQQAANPAAVGTGAPTAPLAQQLQLGSVLDRAMQMAQIQKTKAETDQIRGDTISPEDRAQLTSLEIAFKQAGVEGQQLVNQQQKIYNSFATEMYGLNVDKLRAEVEVQNQNVKNLISSRKLTEEQTQLVVSQYILNNTKLATEEALQKMYGAQAFLHAEEARAVQSKIDYYIATARKSDADRRKVAQEIYNMQKDAFLKDQQMSLNDIEIAMNGIITAYKTKDLDWYTINHITKPLSDLATIISAFSSGRGRSFNRGRGGLQGMTGSSEFGF